FIQGIGVGGEMPVAAVYISELSKARSRGRFFLLYEMIFPVGLMVTGQVAAVLVPLLGWQTMFLIGGLPALLVACLLLPLPESARGLMSKGGFAEAEVVVAQLEGASRKPGAVMAAEPPAATPVPKRVPAPPGSRGKWSELLSPAYRGRTLIVWM